MSEADSTSKPRGRKPTVTKPFQEYHAEIVSWLSDWELTQAELARFLRVEPAALRGALTGRAVHPWILERVRSITGVEPPPDDRPISDRTQTTQRLRSLLVLLPKIEEKIRAPSRNDWPAGIRPALVGDLRELAARATEFAEWLESPMAKTEGTEEAESSEKHHEERKGERGHRRSRKTVPARDRGGA